MCRCLLKTKKNCVLYVFSHLGTLADSRSWRCFPNAVQTEDAILFFGGFYPSYSIREHVPRNFRRIFQIFSKKVKSIRSCASLWLKDVLIFLKIMSIIITEQKYKITNVWTGDSMETLYEYLLKNYKPNEPIFLADLQIEGMSRANLRQQIKNLPMPER